MKKDCERCGEKINKLNFQDFKYTYFGDLDIVPLLCDDCLQEQTEHYEELNRIEYEEYLRYKEEKEAEDE